MTTTLQRFKKVLSMVGTGVLALTGAAAASHAGDLTGYINEDNEIELRMTFPEAINTAHVGKLENGGNFRFNPATITEVANNAAGVTYTWDSDIEYDENKTYDFYVQANSAQGLHYAPGANNTDYMRFEPYRGGQFTPPAGKTLFFLGQNVQTAKEYKDDLNTTLAGAVTYAGMTSGGTTGLFSRLNVNQGILNFHGTLQGHQDSVIAVGSWLVGSEELIAQRDPAILEALHDTLQEMKAADRPIFLRFGYEVEGFWNAHDPASFINAWIYVHDWIEANNAKNITMVWQLASYCRTSFDDLSTAPGTGGNTYFDLDYDAWYPGDEYVDWTALSYFTQDIDCPILDDTMGGLPPGYGNLSDVDANGDSIALDNVMAYLKSKGKPIMIAESTPKRYHIEDLKFMDDAGFEDPSKLIDVTEQQIWDGWFKRYFEFINRYKYDLRAVSYINDEWDSIPGWTCTPGLPKSSSNCDSSYWGDARVQEQPLILSNFQAELANGHFITEPSADQGFDIFQDWNEVQLQNRGQVPYTMRRIPHALPGVVSAVSYDVGGEGVSFHDLDASNNGLNSANGQYPCRFNESVDIGGDATHTGDPSGCLVGWTAEGEWLEYTVDVAGTGASGTDPISFDINITVAHPDDGGVINLLFDGVDYIGPINVPNTGSWDVQNTFVIEGVSIPPGQHVMRLEMTTGGDTFGSTGAFKSIEFQDPNGSKRYQEAYGAPVPGKIQIEEYNRGSAGSAFFDASTGTNVGIAAECNRDDVAEADKASNPVQIALFNGQCTVQSTTSGEWMEYTIEVAEAGTFDINVRAIHSVNSTGGANFSISIDGADVSGSVATPTTFSDAVISGVALTAGEHAVRLNMGATVESYNGFFDYMEFVRTDAADDTNQTAYQTHTISATGTTVIEAGFFDLGGEGVAWTDPSNIFHLQENSDCRIEAGVDPGADVNWLTIPFDGVDNCTVAAFFAGEWLEYTITVPTETTYDVTMLNDSGMPGSFAILDIAGVNILAQPLLSSSENWELYAYDTVSNVTLPAGTHIMRMTVGFGGLNVHKLIFTPVQ